MSNYLTSTIFGNNNTWSGLNTFTGTDSTFENINSNQSIACAQSITAHDIISNGSLNVSGTIDTTNINIDGTISVSCPTIPTANNLGFINISATVNTVTNIFTNANYKCATITLPAGSWILMANFSYVAQVSTTITHAQHSISSTTLTLDPNCIFQTHNSYVVNGVTISNQLSLAVNLIASKTYYMISSFTFTPVGSIIPSSWSSLKAIKVG